MERRSKADAGLGGDSGAGPSSLTMNHPDLDEALKVKEHADRYISSFLRKAGGWNKWQRTCKQGQERRLGGAVAAAGNAVGRRPAAAGDGRLPQAVVSVLRNDHLSTREESGECEGQRRGHRPGDEEGDEVEGDFLDEEGDDDDNDDYMWEAMAEEEEAEGLAAMAAEAGIGDDEW